MCLWNIKKRSSVCSRASKNWNLKEISHNGCRDNCDTDDVLERRTHLVSWLSYADLVMKTGTYKQCQRKKGGGAVPSWLPALLRCFGFPEMGHKRLRLSVHSRNVRFAPNFSQSYIPSQSNMCFLIKTSQLRPERFRDGCLKLSKEKTAVMWKAIAAEVLGGKGHLFSYWFINTRIVRSVHHSMCRRYCVEKS